MEINFIGGAYSDRSGILNAQECENFMVRLDQQDGNSNLALVGVPGSVLFCATGGSGDCRAMKVWKGDLYALVGNTLYRVSAAGTATSVGTVSNSTGIAQIAVGITHMMICDGSKGYYREETDTTLTQITDEDFPAAVSSCCYLDGFFLATVSGSDEFVKSASEDASSWDGLDFASAEDSPDSALFGFARNRVLHIFGEETTELFVNTGDTSFPFTRIAGAVWPFGLGAIRSVAEGPDGLFFLDDKLRIRMAAGYESIPISTQQVEYHIRQYDKTDDAVGWCYTADGHSCYALTFPAGPKTWVFDAATKFWHTRSTGYPAGRYFGNCAAWFADKTIIGDWQNGNLYAVDPGVYTDGGRTIRSMRISQAVQAGGANIFHGGLRLEFETGVGLPTGQGSDPMAMLDWTDDGGKTWSNERMLPMGKIGEYRHEVWAHKLGRSKRRNYRLAITDPVKRVLIGAHLTATIGRQR